MSVSAARVVQLRGIALPPPATSTLPSGSSVAVWPARANPRLAVAVQVRVPGSYSSAEALISLPPVKPPTTSTLPSASSVAVQPPKRVATIFPTAVQDPLLGS